MSTLHITNLVMASHIGQREQNQDCIKYFHSKKTEQSLIVVADGMGGHKGGKIAAESVIKAAEMHWQKHQNIEDVELYLLELVELAQQMVCECQSQDIPNAQSTLCALYLDKTRAVSVHVGDSRVMQFNANGLLKKTADHSLAQLEVLKGKISEDEAAFHPTQNKLYLSIGGSEKPDAEIEYFAIEDSTFVVCTDGFWELFSLNGMHQEVQTLDTNDDLRQLIGQKLSEKSNHDNTTVAIVTVGFNSQNRVANYDVPQESERKLGLVIFLVFIAMFMLIALWFFFSNDEYTQVLKNRTENNLTSHKRVSHSLNQIKLNNSNREENRIKNNYFKFEKDLG